MDVSTTLRDLCLDPTRDSFLAALTSHAASPKTYAPYEPMGAAIVRLCKEGRAREAYDLGEDNDVYRRHHLDITFHSALSLAALELGDMQTLEDEQGICKVLLHAILQTGDGSVRRPLVLAHPNDEDLVLEQGKVQPRGKWAPNPAHVFGWDGPDRRLERHGRRTLSVVRAPGDRELWYDLSVAMRAECGRYIA